MTGQRQASTPLYVVVSLAAGRPLDDVIHDLVRHGFQLEHIFDGLGCLAGHVPRDAVAAVRGVHGVIDVGEVAPERWPPLA